MASARTVSAVLAGGIAFICAGLLLLTLLAPTVEAATLEEKQDAARERIERTSAAIESGKARLEAAREEADAAASEEQSLSGLLADGEERSAELGTRLERAESSLVASRKRLKRARNLLSERLVAIYKQGGTPDNLQLALGAASFDELTSGTEYLTAIQDSNDRLMDRVTDLRKRLVDRVEGLDEARAAIARHNAALSSARDRIASVRAEAESSASGLALANAEREDQIGSLKSDINSWQKKIERQEQVTAEQAEEQVDQHLGGPYSIPTYIVMCESGGDYSLVNPASGAAGAYQIIPSTWEYYGGSGPSAHLASKEEQDRIAAKIWADVGASAWVCA